MKLLVLTVVIYGVTGATGELMFTNTTYAVAVYETQTDFLVRVQAAVAGRRDVEVHYSLPAQNYSEKFSINETTGDVFLRQPFDFEETGNSTIQLTVNATCCSGENMTNAKILVSVRGVDEFSPVFLIDKTTVAFSQSFIANQTARLPLAYDADAPPHDEVLYNAIFRPSERKWEQYFEVHPTTAFLSTTGQCDSSCSRLFQEGKNYTFQFFLTAGAPEAGPDQVVSLEVTVLLVYDDPNHNYPEFVKDTYAIGLLKGTKPSGDTLITVSANDVDTGKNGNIQYSIANTGPERTQTIFKVGSESGIITLQNPLDDEKNYTFVVEATDGGAIPKSGRAEVIVFITGEIQSTGDLLVTYIVAGCLGGVTLILLIAIIILAVRCRRLKKVVAHERTEKENLIRLLHLSNIQIQTPENGTSGRGERFDEPIEPDDYNIEPDYEDPPNPTDVSRNRHNNPRYQRAGTTVPQAYPNGVIRDYLHPVSPFAGPRDSSLVDANDINLDYIHPTKATGNSKF